MLGIVRKTGLPPVWGAFASKMESRPRFTGGDLLVRHTHRPRHVVSPKMVRALLPFYRYDDLRHAYILRGVGQWLGPVLRPRR